jgi:Family of unknown function (DUF6375)
MKVWSNYGSEHSMNLVMIGRFKEVADAERVEELIEQIAARVDQDTEDGEIQFGGKTQRFTQDTQDLLRKLEVWNLAPGELEQFRYDVSRTRNDKEIVLHTDESDVSAFLKLFIEKGAKVEVYSAHDYPDPSKAIQDAAEPS